jgi:outer membrane protein assembly factor BamB
MTIHWTASTDYADGGVYVVWNKELRTHYGFSTDTGSYMWATAEPEHYLQIYGWGAVEHSWHIAYDKLYTSGVSGILYCYDIFTGQRLWTYESVDPYSEYLFGNNFWNWISFISDGKIYMAHTEHSAIDPKPRGAPFVCLDAETGEVIWKAEGLFRSTRWGGRGLIGDGIMATMDTYDQRIYAVGKGPSAITIDAEPKVSIEGGSVVIEGMVTDISAGTQDPAITARFPNGVACPRPADTVGVTVVIDVMDANGNTYTIGTPTTDTNGFYSHHWNPEVPGKYTVFAHFVGTEGYYASVAETAFAVDEAPQPTPPPEPTPAPMTDTYVLGMGAAALIAIIVIGLVLIILVRKR